MGTEIARQGLSPAEVQERLQRFGPNEVPEHIPPRFLKFFRKLTSPVALMLEATLLIELWMGNRVQAALITVLLLLNAVIASVQEATADRVLDELRHHLAVRCRALRSGIWQELPAAALVPDDLIHLRAGDIVAADARLLDGNVEVDQSALTGESLPVELGPAGTALSGGVIRRGEATAVVVATGVHSASGKTVQLVQLAQPRSHLEETVLSIVKYLVAGDLVLAALVLAQALLRDHPMGDALSFALMLLIASVPVALPATFSLATALGSRALAAHGVLVTRFGSVPELAALNVLCSDKTGTLTENALTLDAVVTMGDASRSEILSFAALTCDEATQDRIDLAILAQAKADGLLAALPAREGYVPFDFTTKRSEAHFSQNGGRWVVTKGAPRAVAAVLGAAAPEQELAELARTGHRVVAVAAGPEGRQRLVGLLGFRDPPRKDSGPVIGRLRELGIRVVMVTGDDPLTAAAIAREVGLGERIADRGWIEKAGSHALLETDVLAGVYPADKLRLVEQLQVQNAVVGMMGDGVNDAPALKRAEVGIAVPLATDVARAAAGLVLTRPGLSAVAEAILIGREIHERMLTYTLNKIVKTFHISLLLSLGIILLNVFITTPRHLLLLLVLNDFITMSLSSDRVVPSPSPVRWNIPALSLIGVLLAVGWTAFSFGVWWAGRAWFSLSLPQLQTLIFVLLVLTSQATIYLVRTRTHLWQSPPGFWLATSTVGDLIAVSVLSLAGILVQPIPALALAALISGVLVFTAVLDAIKVPLLARGQRTPG